METMLVGWERKRVEFRLQKAFQDLKSRAKEGDGAVTSTQICWFTGFGNRGYNKVPRHSKRGSILSSKQSSRKV